jgi:biotin transporter BioY
MGSVFVFWRIGCIGKSFKQKHRKQHLREGTILPVAALVLGIVGFALAWIPLFGYIMPILAIVFGLMSRNQTEKKGFSLTGIILGIASLVIFKLGFWLLALIGSMAGY